MLQSLKTNRTDLGEQNRRLVLAEILFEGPISRTQIAKKIGLTGASVSRITRDLIAAGLIEEGERFIESTRAGRKFVGLRVRPGGCFVIAIAINAFRQDIAIADLANNVLASRQMHFEDLCDAEQVLDGCAVAIKEMIAENAIEHDRVIGCGVAITGAVDPSRVLLRSAPPLGWNDVDIGEILGRHIDYPVYLDNIPNAKNIAARCFGPSRKAENVLLFNASLAVGCSLMIGESIYRGADYQAGLIESMMIPDPASGELFPVDRLAGGYAMVDIRDTSAQASQLGKIIELANQNDGAAGEKLARAGRALAHVVSNSFSLLHPQMLIVSGPMMESSHYRSGLFAGLKAMIDPLLLDSRIIYSPMTSQQAALSLAIHQALMQTDLAQLPALQPLAS